MSALLAEFVLIRTSDVPTRDSHLAQLTSTRRRLADARWRIARGSSFITDHHEDIVSTSHRRT